MRTLIAWLLGLLLAATSAAAPRPVVLMRIDGGIGAATADHVHRGLAYAAQHDAQLVVLQLDTPGGLDSAMRAIIKDILASPVPVASYVAPNGARAASAGTYILYASHVAAMAPATNLGAATPVELGMPMAERPPSKASEAASGGDAMSAKRLADAAAYLRSLAELRGRNAAWAEQAVRESVSLSASEALARNVITLVATDADDLLRRLDGRALPVASGATVQLATADAPRLAFDADWRGRLLGVIGDPSLALILMMIGVYGLLFEFMNPGYVLPGVVGGICLLLALFALQMLPVNYAGVGLIALGVSLLVAEAFVPSFGVLGLGGVIALAFGAVLLVDSDAPGADIPYALVTGVTVVSAAFVFCVAAMAAKARRRPVVSGAPALLGATGRVVEFAEGAGWALVGGEHWRVSGPLELRVGTQVRVERVHGHTLEVAPLQERP